SMRRLSDYAGRQWLTVEGNRALQHPLSAWPDDEGLVVRRRVSRIINQWVLPRRQRYRRRTATRLTVGDVIRKMITAHEAEGRRVGECSPHARIQCAVRRSAHEHRNQ